MMADNMATIPTVVQLNVLYVVDAVVVCDIESINGSCRGPSQGSAENINRK